MASFICPECGKKSSGKLDITEGYCRACHDWTGVEPPKQSLHYKREFVFKRASEDFRILHTITSVVFALLGVTAMAILWAFDLWNAKSWVLLGLSLLVLLIPWIVYNLRRHERTLRALEKRHPLKPRN